MPLVTQQLRLTNSADVFKSCRWRGLDDTLYELASGRLQIRATESASSTLLDQAAILTDGDTTALAILTKEAITAANFEALLNPAVWEFTITRVTDGRTISAVGGSVVWSPGVVR